MTQTQDYDMSLQKASSMEEVVGSQDKVKIANYIWKSIIKFHKKKPAKCLLLIYTNKFIYMDIVPSHFRHTLVSSLY